MGLSPRPRAWARAERKQHPARAGLRYWQSQAAAAHTSAVLQVCPYGSQWVPPAYCDSAKLRQHPFNQRPASPEPRTGVAAKRY